VENGRIDKALLRLGVAAGGYQPGFCFVRVLCARRLRRIHALSRYCFDFAAAR
jgi:hypothetical protein